ncbi:MAG: TDP-N-acetylfucosamine:lipid II N-acetylfucosaminyltransferase [Bacteroidales bacterium]|nr:TDP-N-acetylfucosamine:lipid II N-acetylfucosaminyltransferase [Bacteroidales bacterium]MDZ4203377.1 TDP-N-acetylfucosamine:lipid II N-acetylfucosaminyltransferase [Bacteroidales bacterium]
MIVHLFASQTNYSFTLLQLLANQIDLEDHLFIFGIGYSQPMTFKYDDRIASRILYTKKAGDLFSGILPALYRANWIFIHSLAYDPSLLFWRFNLRLIKKSTWIIWGSDLYAFQKKNLSIRARLYEWCRRKIIPCLPEIAAFVEEDANLAKEIYHSPAIYIPIIYPIPVSLSMLDRIKQKGKTEPINIMIGNSGDPSNRHIEMIAMLAHFSNEAITIQCPLSYGGTPAYKLHVMEFGQSIFGDKFQPILNLVDAEAYSRVLGRIDIALMNHKRQQGLGNIMSLLYLGKKVYLRSDTTSFYFFSRNNCLVFDISKVPTMAFEQFSEPISDSQLNKEYVARVLSEDNYNELWLNLINRHLK